MKNITLPKTNIPVIITTNDNKQFIIEGDTTKTAGCVRFTHEWAINVRLRKDKSIKFSGGWEIACEDIEYSSKDADYFEYLHPGVLADIETVVKEIAA